MIAYFLERPYLIAILIALVILTLFVCVKAGQASARRGRANEAIIKKLKEENEILRQKLEALLTFINEHKEV